MHKKPGFNLRDICGEQIVVAEGKENIDFSNIISMNETSAYLWRSVGDGEFDAETMASLLAKEYQVDRKEAYDDSCALLKQWYDAGIIE